MAKKLKIKSELVLIMTDENGVETKHSIRKTPTTTFEDHKGYDGVLYTAEFKRDQHIKRELKTLTGLLEDHEEKQSRNGIMDSW